MIRSQWKQTEKYHSEVSTVDKQPFSLRFFLWTTTNILLSTFYRGSLAYAHWKQHKTKRQNLNKNKILVFLIFCRFQSLSLVPLCCLNFWKNWPLVNRFFNPFLDSFNSKWERFVKFYALNLQLNAIYSIENYFKKKSNCCFFTQKEPSMEQTNQQRWKRGKNP